MKTWIVLGQRKGHLPFIEWGFSGGNVAKNMATFLNGDYSQEKKNGIIFKPVEIEIPDTIRDDESDGRMELG